MIAKKLLARILVAVGLWVSLMAVCFALRSYLGYAGLALLYLWYFYIPFLLVIVTFAWFMVQTFARPRGSSRPTSKAAE